MLEINITIMLNFESEITFKEHLRKIKHFKTRSSNVKKTGHFHVPRTNTEYLENVLITKSC